MVIRELVALLGVKTDPSSFKAANASLDGLVGFAKGAAGAIAGFFAVKWVKSAVDQVTELGDSLQELSAKTGMATDDLQKLKFAAEQSGSSFEDVQTAIRKLQLWQEKIDKGGKEEFKTFYRLGVSIRDSGGEMKSATQLLMDFADSFRNLGSDSERTATAIEIFGKSGTGLIPFLKGGSAGIQTMFTELEDLGGLMSGDLVNSSDQYRDNLAKMKAGFLGVKMAIAEELLPEILRLQEQGLAWWKENKGEVKTTLKDLDKVAISLGVVLKLLWDIGVALKNLFTSIPGLFLLAGFGFTAMRSAKGTMILLTWMKRLIWVWKFARTILGGLMIAFTLWSLIFDSFAKMVKDGTGKAFELFDALSYLFGFDMVTPVKEIVRWFQLLFSKPTKAIADLRAAWKLIFKDIWKGLTTGFGEMFSGIFAVVTGWLNRIWDAVVEWWNNLISLPKRAGSWLAEKFGWTGAAPNVGGSAVGELASLNRAGVMGTMVNPMATAAASGSKVDQKTSIQIDVKAAPGMSEKKLADEISKKVSKEVDRQNRAAIRALIPGAVGA